MKGFGRCLNGIFFMGYIKRFCLASHVFVLEVLFWFSRFGWTLQPGLESDLILRYFFVAEIRAWD